MKYSIIMPYIMRAELLHNTLISFNHFYKDRYDYEVIIVEDIKNKENSIEHEKLLKLLKFFSENADKYNKIIHVESNFPNCYNPAPLFNLGVKKSSGDFLVITNPEVFHTVNILSEFDKYFEEDQDQYVVCSCENGGNFLLNINNFNEFKYQHLAWYQHSVFRNLKYHFCTALSRKTYWRANGFDERFADGYAFDDNGFRDDVLEVCSKVTIADNLHTVHQNHGPLPIQIDNMEYRLIRNRAIYYLKKQKKTDKEIEDFIKSL